MANQLVDTLAKTNLSVTNLQPATTSLDTLTSIKALLELSKEAKLGDLEAQLKKLADNEMKYLTFALEELDTNGSLRASFGSGLEAAQMVAKFAKDLVAEKEIRDIFDPITTKAEKHVRAERTKISTNYKFVT